MKAQVKILRAEMDSEAGAKPKAAAATQVCEGNTFEQEDLSLLFESLGMGARDGGVRQPREAVPSFGMGDRGIEDRSGRAGFPGYIPTLSPIPAAAPPSRVTSMRWGGGEL